MRGGIFLIFPCLTKLQFAKESGTASPRAKSVIELQCNAYESRSFMGLQWLHALPSEAASHTMLTWDVLLLTTLSDLDSSAPFLPVHPGQRHWRTFCECTSVCLSATELHELLTFLEAALTYQTGSWVKAGKTVRFSSLMVNILLRLHQNCQTIRPAT